MLRPLKFNLPEKDFFAFSDLHYNHDKDFIWGPRGFSSVEESNRVLIERWNETCDENSIVAHLGDFIFNDSKGEKMLALLHRLRFKELYLLLGNHVSGHKQLYLDTLYNQTAQTDQEVYPLYLSLNEGKRVCFLPQYVEFHVNRDELILCHYPIISHNHLGHGSTHLCGHSHGSCEFSHKNVNAGRRLDVGVESFGRPVNLTFIKNHLKGRDTDTRDHHDSKTT